MATKGERNCFLCHHPIVKMLIEFYCLVWGLIGVLFLIGFIWGLVQYKTLETNGFFGSFRRWQGLNRIIGPEKGMELRGRLQSLSTQEGQCLIDFLGEERVEQLRQTPGLATLQEKIDIKACLD